MRLRTGFILGFGSLAILTPLGAQPPGGRDRPDRSTAQGDPVTRMMAFDANKDGKLTRDEITDPRLLRLFDRADANKDGVVTKEELTSLFAKEALPAGGGPGDFGGGPGGPGGFGPPRPGQIMPPFLQEILQLTDAQKKQMEALQKEVDSGLDKILTDEQKKELREMRMRGPGGGPPGGGGGPPRGPGRPE